MQPLTGLRTCVVCVLCGRCCYSNINDHHHRLHHHLHYLHNHYHRRGVIISGNRYGRRKSSIYFTHNIHDTLSTHTRARLTYVYVQFFPPHFKTFFLCGHMWRRRRRLVLPYAAAIPIFVVVVRLRESQTSRSSRLRNTCPLVSSVRRVSPPPWVRTLYPHTYIISCSYFIILINIMSYKYN